MQCIVNSSKYDTEVVYAILSNWFTNAGQFNSLNKTVVQYAEHVSYKFVEVRYQIASRLEGVPSINLTLDQIMKLEAKKCFLAAVFYFVFIL